MTHANLVRVRHPSTTGSSFKRQSVDDELLFVLAQEVSRLRAVRQEEPYERCQDARH